MPNLRKATADAIFVAGQHMSNWMYNMAQSDKLDPHQREAMREMVRDWDAVRTELRKKKLKAP